MALVDLIRDRNADRASDAITKAVMGAVFTGVTFFVILMGCWFFSLVATTTVTRAGWLALGLTVLYLALAFLSAWKLIDPMTELVPPSVKDAAPEDAIETIFPGGADRFESAFQREPVPGWAAILLAGPVSLVEAIAAWQDRIPETPALLESAQKLLDELVGTALAADAVVDRDALVLLVRLGVVKAVRHAGDEVTISLNAKGKTLVSNPP
jgi:hypothetical protein